MRKRFVTVDVFTDECFKGNPLAVVLDADGLDTVQMQALASEFGYVETTFVHAPEDPAHDARVRIFTPDREIGFAGHPTIGTAYALARDRLRAGVAITSSLVFEEAAGLVTVHLIDEGGAIVGGNLLTPQHLNLLSTVDADTAASCICLTPDDLRLDQHLPRVASVGLPFLFIELKSREILRRARPDRQAYDCLFPLDGARSVYAYVRADDEAHSHVPDDIHSRMFTWRLAEDPATGSAAAALTAMLAELRGRAVALRVSQGEDMGRPSLVMTRSVAVDGRTKARVGGRCAPMFEGSFVASAMHSVSTPDNE